MAILTTLRRRWKSLLFPALGLAFVAVVFIVVLPGVANYGDVWDAARRLSWPWLLVLAVAAVLNVVTFGPPMMAALPGMRYRPALAVSLASNASTYVAPGGAAVGAGFQFAMLRGWGFSGRSVTLAVTVFSIWNQLVTFGTPSLAVALLSLEGGRNPLLQTLAWVGFALFAVIVGGFALALHSERQARTIGDLAGRVLARVTRRAQATGASFVRFRRDALQLLRARWHVLTLATLAGHYTVFLVLYVTLRAVGIAPDEVTVVEAFAGWSLVRVLGAIPIVPGGFGVVELGLTGALVGFGGPNAEVVAAVLIYRFLTVAPPLALGAVFAATWRRHNPHWREPVTEEAATDGA